MCNCLGKSEEKMLAHLKSLIVEKEGVVHRWNNTDSGYTNTAFSLDGGDMSRRLFLPFEVVYTKLNKNREESREKKFKQSIFFSFCPFCGKKYETKSEMKPVEK